MPERTLKVREDFSKRIYSLGQWKVMEDSLPPELLEEYKQAFQILDRRNTGMISLRDLSTVTCSIGIQLSELELRLYVTQITGVPAERCDAVTCTIDFKNFLVLMAVILTECISGEEVLRIFKEFDKDGDGFISPDELRALLSRYGHEATDSEVKAMMEEADKDGDGMVSLHEFVTVMSTSHLMQTRILHNLVPANNTTTSTTNKPTTSGEEDPVTSSSSSSCEDDDDDANLVVKRHHQSRHHRRNNRLTGRKSSVVGWLKTKSRGFQSGGSPKDATKDATTTANPNSNNNNNSSPNPAPKSGRRRSSLAQKLSITMDMMKRQVSRSKLTAIPDDDDSADE